MYIIYVEMKNRSADSGHSMANTVSCKSIPKFWALITRVGDFFLRVHEDYSNTNIMIHDACTCMHYTLEFYPV